MEGDVDKAFKHTYAYYPSVLKDNEQTYFRLRCRKFIEMIRQCAELHLMAQSSSVKHSGHAIGTSNDAYDDVFEHEMELDDQMHNGGGWEKMEMEEADAGLKHLTMLQETIKYGQVLQSEFRDDDRKEVKKALEETFSLLAYEDPKSSVVAHLLEPSGRIPVAEELNSAILGEFADPSPWPKKKATGFVSISVRAKLILLSLPWQVVLGRARAIVSAGRGAHQ